MSIRRRLMTRTLRAGFMLLLGAGCLAGCSMQESVELHVLSYNIHHGEGLDGVIDLPRIAELIRESDADLVALQEVDRGVARSHGVDQPAELARLTGMHAVFDKNIDYQGGEYGNAVLSKFPIEDWENHWLPKSLPNEQRGMLEVHVRAGDTPIVFLATHFDYHPEEEERLMSVSAVRDLVDELGDLPVVLAGDLNATPTSKPLDELATFLRSADTLSDDARPSFPADMPDKRIDYVMFTDRGKIRCTGCEVLLEPIASDHRPVLATLHIKQPVRAE
ncbi:MAG: endonuclease/exonuclease/phosphatase family protein [Phycisphaerales bacterium]|nr:endonuclease/exonuclease/phosphatase family protein [Phycisphaerales bacterium]